MPLPLSLSPAAVYQCFVLVSLCTSIADPNWIYIKNSTDPNGKQIIYGVSFTLHAVQNLTDTAPLGGVNGVGMHLLYTLTALCYAAVLFSSASFLLDFLGVRVLHFRLVTSLHICTATLCCCILVICTICLYVIRQNIQKLTLALRLDRPLAKPNGLNAYLGESLIIFIFGIIFSIMASVFSCFSPSNSVTDNQYLPVEDDDGERERLIPGEEQEEFLT